MSEKLRPVLIGDMVVSTDPEEVLIVYGLGSCVAICLYDPATQIGGMLHALLPTSNGYRHAVSNPTKFVDQGLPLLIDSLTVLGAKRSRLQAYLCGGAHVLKVSPQEKHFNIGHLNVQMALQGFKAAGLILKARATGGQTGRTIKLYLSNGHVTVKKLGQPERILGSAHSQDVGD
jgi:chemotaxis protein CheD